MIDEQKIQELDLAFQRILTLPVSRSTFRQMQNAILFFTGGDRDKATQLLESLLTREIKEQKEKISSKESWKKFIDVYAVKTEVAREVSERGEFISIVTSDIIGHPQLPIFGNRVRRIDGKEFEFITDVEGTLQLLNHFSSRIQEMEKVEKNKNVLKGRKKELTALKARIEQLISAASD